MTALLAIVVAALVVAALVAWRVREVVIIYPPQVGLLYRDGRFQRVLDPGRHVRFDPFGRIRIVNVSLAEMPAPLGEMTVMSKDQFSFRLGLSPVLKVLDPKLYMEGQGLVADKSAFPYVPVGAIHPLLHPEVAAAAMEAAAARTLAEILGDQRAVAGEVEQRLGSAIPGAAIERVLLTAITLPPETRKMFTDVERARMEGQAALERARGEQAALRVLANAARLVNDNPALANLRLLQAIESSKGSTTLVVGNPGAPLPGLGVQGAGPAGRAA